MQEIHRQPREASRPPQDTGLRRRRRTVLLVEDEPDIASSARQVLERFVPDVRVVSAPSAQAGLDILRAGHVDVLLVDYRLPGKDGLEFVRQAHELEPGLPAILMTAYGTVDLAARAINEHRIAGFLAKPFDAVVLAETVQKALQREA
jgi:DNA-binding NtrC family response regulator